MQDWLSTHLYSKAHANKDICSALQWEESLLSGFPRLKFNAVAVEISQEMAAWIHRHAKGCALGDILSVNNVDKKKRIKYVILREFSDYLRCANIRCSDAKVGGSREAW